MIIYSLFFISTFQFELCYPFQVRITFFVTSEKSDGIYISKNMIPVSEVDNLVELIQAQQVGLGNTFLLILNTSNWSPNESLNSVKQTMIRKKGV
jgi:hypothetical protein